MRPQGSAQELERWKRTVQVVKDGDSAADVARVLGVSDRAVRGWIFLAARVTSGPGQGSPQFRPAARAAAEACPIDTLLADGGYDAEHNQAYARLVLKVRSTVIRLNRRNHGRRRAKTMYRRQMARRFRRKPRGSRHRRVLGQRWQVEGGFSRQKRLLGSAPRARQWASQKREIHLRV